MCGALRAQYGVEPIAVNCLTLTEDGIAAILQQVLYEFPVGEIGFILPRYIGALPARHPAVSYTHLYNPLISISTTRTKIIFFFMQCDKISIKRHFFIDICDKQTYN